jgi:DNA-binding NarL/FixJ family response regulator
METQITIMLFDDNKRIRDSLSLLFSGHPLFNWKGAHMDATHVMDVMDAGAPDVVLMDIDMPGINGIQAVRSIKKKYPDQVIMMLTTFEDDDKVFDAICAGASGYIVKSKSLTHLIDAVKEVYNGGAPMSPSIARKVLQLFKEKNAPGDADSFHLTDREKEVLVHLINGSSYKMIAGAMQLSYDTVHSHIKNIYKKLQVNSVSEAVSKAMRLRL